MATVKFSSLKFQLPPLESSPGLSTVPRFSQKMSLKVPSLAREPSSTLAESIMLAEKKSTTTSDTNISQRIRTIAPFAIRLSNQYFVRSTSVTLRRAVS